MIVAVIAMLAVAVSFAVASLAVAAIGHQRTQPVGSRAAQAECSSGQLHVTAGDEAEATVAVIQVWIYDTGGPCRLETTARLLVVLPAGGRRVHGNPAVIDINREETASKPTELLFSWGNWCGRHFKPHETVTVATKSVRIFRPPVLPECVNPQHSSAVEGETYL